MESLQAVPNNSPAKLLVVDDESHIRIGLVKALSIIGYSVEEAASGAEALMLLENSTFDLMVLDMVMPEMNGEEVLQRVNQLQPDAASVIRPYISRLRSKIENNPQAPSLIHTIRRRGYQFTARAVAKSYTKSVRPYPDKLTI